MAERRPLVSIIMVTLNGMRDLPAVFGALAAQRVDFAVETIAVDSGSTDGTAGFLQARVDRFLTVSRSAFDHGATRNLGLAAARGDLCVLLVQDAVPADPGWLGALVAPLRTDAAVAGSCARQRPRPEASAVTRFYLERWYAGRPEPRRARLAGPAAFARLAPPERLAACVFDNVCSCLRRSVWQAHPFPATPIAEDLAWAKEVLLAGHELVFAPAATVIHSHDRSPLYELRRTSLLHAQLHRLFGLRTVATPAQLLRAILWSLGAHASCLADEHRARRLHARELARAAGLALAWPLGQYLGGRSAARGWPPLDFARGV